MSLFTKYSSKYKVAEKGWNSSLHLQDSLAYAIKTFTVCNVHMLFKFYIL